MKLSIRVQYGLQALLELALNYGGGPVQIKEIARNQKLPIRFLEQILLVLKKGGLVASTRGKSGGYSLAKKPSTISVLSLIEALEGPIELTNKKMKKNLVLNEVFARIESDLLKSLKGITLEEVVMKKRKNDQGYIYYI